MALLSPHMWTWVSSEGPGGDQGCSWSLAGSFPSSSCLLLTGCFLAFPSLPLSLIRAWKSRPVGSVSAPGHCAVTQGAVGDPRSFTATWPTPRASAGREEPAGSPTPQFPISLLHHLEPSGTGTRRSPGWFCHQIKANRSFLYCELGAFEMKPTVSSSVNLLLRAVSSSFLRAQVRCFPASTGAPGAAEPPGKHRLTLNEGFVLGICKAGGVSTPVLGAQSLPASRGDTGGWRGQGSLSEVRMRRSDAASEGWHCPSSAPSQPWGARGCPQQPCEEQGHQLNPQFLGPLLCARPEG